MGRTTPKRTAFYGYLAEFEEPDDLVEATRRTWERGYRKMDAFTPFPVEGLAEAMEHRGVRLPLFTLLGGIAGGLGAYYLQYWVNVVSYPVNIGGRPHHSWPAFIPITFELTILAAALTAVLAMLALNGLPKPYHPLFHVPHFELASRNRFFLLVQADDPLFEAEATRAFLEERGALAIYEVPH